MPSFAQRAPVQSGVDHHAALHTSEEAPDVESAERDASAERTGGPLDELREQVEAGDAPRLLATIARLQRDQPALVNSLLADAALMHDALGVLGADAALALIHLGFGDSRPLKDGVTWLAGGGEGRFTVEGWMRMVAGRSAAQQAEVVADPQAWAAVRALPGDPMDLLPGLSMDPMRLKAAIEAQPDLLVWVGERGGVERQTQLLERITDAESAAATRAEYKRLGIWNRYLSELPDGPASDEETQRQLYHFLLASEDGSPAEWSALFAARFGVSLAQQGGTWDLPSVTRLWQLGDLTPPEHLAATIKVIREGNFGEATGWAGGGEIGMEWGTDMLGATEIGAYTDDGDPMRGLNIFDACVRHEIGHNVGASNGWDQPGGFVYSEFGWQQHDDFRSLLEEVFLPAHPLPLERVSASQRERALGLILDALGQVTNHSQAAYRVAVERVSRGLWAAIQDEPLMRYLVQRATPGAWDLQDDLDGRSYHVAYNWFGFCSCPTNLYAKKVSTYAMRSPMEWFAEAYATFYAEADQPGMPLGRLMQGRDPTLYARMMGTVHPVADLGQETGQGTVGMPAAQGPAPEAPAPTP
ncbi:MAG: hypothetical protein H6739_28810 [Alphaproteobacteria bacterium]|nr:hypothetical protein [Alphaproteobacteria bacterium]